MILDDLISMISARSFANVFNPWMHSDPLDVHDPQPGYAQTDRQQRLWRHFNCAPHYLLIGEAPGYQGCHFSGVPFTNEALLLQGVIPRIDRLSKRITTRERPWSEPSATIVWRTLHELRIANDVVMWNAFGWHPHKPGEPMSNRAPTLLELSAGRDVLKAVCDYFAPAKIVAVGRVAEKALKALGITPHAAVRHPSMGGAGAFYEGLRKLCTGDTNV
jgi:uracil-DNA glycosylase